MKLYRLFAFATALAIVLLLANAPSLMLRAEARHRQITVTQQHIAVDDGSEVSGNSTSGVHPERGGSR
jgi:ferric-dicitrate binding protein FerR (iron transport regulator)